VPRVFDEFTQTSDAGDRRRVVMSAGASLAFYGAVAAVIVAMVGANAATPIAKKVQVAFRPPPPPAEAQPPPPAPPPAVPKTMKVRPVKGLAPPRPLVAPPAVPVEKPAEAEPTGEPVEIASATGSGSYGGAAISSPGAEPRRAAPIHLPESASPPQALGSNVVPAYPEQARSVGREGVVILKIVIDEEGRVTSVEAMRGDEPFASAAVRAVRSWRYRPATLGGTPISTYRIVKVPFRLRN
jgi:protein TonB